MSQIKIRQSLADKLPEFPETLEHLRTELFDRQPGLRFSRLWLGPFDQGGYCYSESTGMHKPRSAGNDLH